MSEQLIESLENPSMNHTYGAGIFSNNTNQNQAESRGLESIQEELDELSFSSQALSIQSVNQRVFLSDILLTCSNNQTFEEMIQYYALNYQIGKEYRSVNASRQLDLGEESSQFPKL